MINYPEVKLKPGKEHSLRRFHPWVFSGAVASAEKTLSDGELVNVVAHDGKFLGTGHCGTGSIAVRIFSFNPLEDEKKFWLEKLKNAFELRKNLGFADNPHTTIWRLVNAEGDGIPGLIIDVFGSTAVVQAHSIGIYDLLPLLVELLDEVMPGKISSVFNKSEEKLFAHSGTATTNTYLKGGAQETVCRENDLLFNVDWEQGQKTGFFIDQRENRTLLAKYSSEKKVLNTYCYSGAFSVYALAHGAAEVHSVDSSQRALDLLEKNLVLNSLDGAKHVTIKSDVQEFLHIVENDFDLVVLDPPAFAKSLSARHRAVQAYKRLNETALQKIKRGGLLFTFSCSQAVTPDLFFGAVMSASISARRQVRVLHRLHQPADHPVSVFHPEGEYLKGLVLEVE